MLADFLVVDAGKPYAEQGSFLEIELAALRGEAHETCGGRAPNDDVMDRIFTQLINAGNGSASATGSTTRAARRRGRSRTWRRPNPDPPEPPKP